MYKKARCHVFSEPGAQPPEASERFKNVGCVPRMPPDVILQRLLRQFLYFCTSKCVSNGTFALEMRATCSALMALYRHVWLVRGIEPSTCGAS